MELQGTLQGTLRKQVCKLQGVIVIYWGHGFATRICCCTTIIPPAHSLACDQVRKPRDVQLPRDPLHEHPALETFPTTSALRHSAHL